MEFGIKWAKILINMLPILVLLVKLVVKILSLSHESADVEALTCGIVLGAFEFQGQKCSAASRAYIPEKPLG